MEARASFLLFRRQRSASVGRILNYMHAHIVISLWQWRTAGRKELRGGPEASAEKSKRAPFHDGLPARTPDNIKQLYAESFELSRTRHTRNYVCLSRRFAKGNKATKRSRQKPNNHSRINISLASKKENAKKQHKVQIEDEKNMQTINKAVHGKK